MNYPDLSDLNRDDESIILPMGTGKPRDIGPVAVMVSAEPDLRYIKKNLRKGKSRSFFMSTLFTPDNGEKGISSVDSYSFTGPYMGAPYGAALLDSLIAKGAEKIIVLGWCGAVSPLLHAGDIVVPKTAISDEGTSRHYMEFAHEFPLVPSSHDLREILVREMIKKDIPHHGGTIWTTDAIYRETKKKVAFFKGRGAVGVDMECSALFAIAKYRKKDIAAILVVSDEVTDSGWKPGFRAKRFKDSRKKAAHVVLDICLALNFSAEP